VLGITSGKLYESVGLSRVEETTKPKGVQRCQSNQLRG
jgi:hypothetical protein